MKKLLLVMLLATASFAVWGQTFDVLEAMKLQEKDGSYSYFDFDNLIKQGDEDVTKKMTAQQKQVYNMIARPEFELWQVAPTIESQMGWTKNQLKKFLAKKEYFENIGWGKYKKLYLPEL